MMKRKSFKGAIFPQLNNKGSSLVVVIVAFGFIGILASMLMYMSMMNYQMKKNNLEAKDSFYSAETVLDEIRVGLEKDMSAALQNAYQEVLINFDNTTVEGKESKLRYEFFTGLESALAAGGDTTAYDLTKLYSYLEKTDSTFDGGSFSHGAVLETTYNGITSQVMKNEAGDYVDEDSQIVVDAKGKMERLTTGIVLRNVKVTYTDEDGYVSVIETDLRINLPDMEFVQSVTLPSLNTYSLVAQENIEVLPVQDSELNLLSDNYIAGSFYAKRLLIGNNGEADSAERQAPFVKVYLKEPVGEENAGKRMVVAEDIYLNAGTKLTSYEHGELWTDTIVMNGAHVSNSQEASEVQFLGNHVYLADDVLIQGKKNILKAGTVTADGKYMGKFIGFGGGNTTDDSSSIVVNGTDTELHFEEVTNLTLAGNTYIGLSDVEDELLETDGVSNAGKALDVPMGQSIAVKSDQIAYLVPAVCIGIDENTGEQVEANITNPMTLETYKEIMAHEDVIEVSNEIACASLGGKSLKDYGLVTTGTNPMFQKYFKRISSEITLVYYYVLFDNTSDTSMQYANTYFQDYYKVNKNTLDAYTKLYTDDIQIRDSATGFYTLHLAGNVVRYNADDTLSIKEATAAYDDANANYQNQLVTYESKFKALNKKLIESYELLTASEKADSANVYTNLVNEAKIGMFFTEVGGSKYFFKDETGGSVGKAVVVNGDYTYPNVEDGEFEGIIMATGDVAVSKSFKGTILSGGSITLDRNVSVEPAKEEVVEAMLLSKQVGAVKYYVTDFLYGGEGYLSEQSAGYLKNNVNLGELITYENWQKQ